jgi:hypothetical protein
LPHASWHPACESVVRDFLERLKEIENWAFRSWSDSENTLPQSYVRQFVENSWIVVGVRDGSPIPQMTLDYLRLSIEQPEKAGFSSLACLTRLNVVKREHTQSAQFIG